MLIINQNLIHVIHDKKHNQWVFLTFDRQCIAFQCFRRTWLLYLAAFTFFYFDVIIKSTMKVTYKSLHEQVTDPAVIEGFHETIGLRLWQPQTCPGVLGPNCSPKLSRKFAFRSLKNFSHLLISSDDVSVLLLKIKSAQSFSVLFNVPSQRTKAYQSIPEKQRSKNYDLHLLHLRIKMKLKYFVRGCCWE